MKKSDVQPSRYYRAKPTRKKDPVQIWFIPPNAEFGEPVKDRSKLSGYRLDAEGKSTHVEAVRINPPSGTGRMEVGEWRNLVRLGAITSQVSEKDALKMGLPIANYSEVAA